MTESECWAREKPEYSRPTAGVRSITSAEHTTMKPVDAYPVSTKRSDASFWAEDVREPGMTSQKVKDLKQEAMDGELMAWWM
jgi:hypothetical protein